MGKTATKKPERKIKHKTWNDLKHDKKQQGIYKENIAFLAGLHSKYVNK